MFEFQPRSEKVETRKEKNKKNKTTEETDSNSKENPKKRHTIPNTRRDCLGLRGKVFGGGKGGQKGRAELVRKAKPGG